MKSIQCPLCGYRFSPDQTGHSACAECPLHKNCESCNIISCPNCNYGFVVESKTLNFLADKLKKVVKKGEDDE